MATYANIYVGVAGHFGRSDEGSVGIFRRAAACGEWQHVLKGLKTHAVCVHPADPNVLFAGTADGVWRSTDRGTTFKRTSFPDRAKQIWSFLVDARDAKRVHGKCNCFLTHQAVGRLSKKCRDLTFPAPGRAHVTS